MCVCVCLPVLSTWKYPRVSLLLPHFTDKYCLRLPLQVKCWMLERWILHGTARATRQTRRTSLRGARSISAPRTATRFQRLFFFCFLPQSLHLHLKYLKYLLNIYKGLEEFYGMYSIYICIYIYTCLCVCYVLFFLSCCYPFYHPFEIIKPSWKCYQAQTTTQAWSLLFYNRVFFFWILM